MKNIYSVGIWERELKAILHNMMNDYFKKIWKMTMVPVGKEPTRRRTGYTCYTYKNKQKILNNSISLDRLLQIYNSKGYPPVSDCL